MARPDISVVVPFYNEEGSIKELYARLVSALSSVSLSYELIFVDDGSIDSTFLLGKAIALNDHRVRVIKFRRNYGQTAAMVAGIKHSRSDIVITMDGDLQNDPRDIPRFASLIASGYDVVVGWRYDRKDRFLARKLPSLIANWLIAKVTGVPIHDNGCSLKAFRGSLIKAVPLYSDMHRFIPAMLSIAGPAIKEIKVQHHARRFGQSKYGISRVYKVILDLLAVKTISTFFNRPLTWFLILSSPLLAIGSTCILYALFFSPYPHTPLPILGSGLLYCASSLILALSGVIGEMVYHTGDLRAHNIPIRLVSLPVDKT